MDCSSLSQAGFELRKLPFSVSTIYGDQTGPLGSRKASYGLFVTSKLRPSCYLREISCWTECPNQGKNRMFLCTLSTYINGTDAGIDDKYSGMVSYTWCPRDISVLIDVLARQSRSWAIDNHVSGCSTCSLAIIGDEYAPGSSWKGCVSCRCDLLTVA